jgi:hypothetical protein
MKNTFPCPSPLGTNTERLYLIRRFDLDAPKMAQDAAMPDDDAPEAGAAPQPSSPDAYNEFAQFLAANLDPDLLGQADELLRRLLSTDDDVVGDAYPPSSRAPAMKPAMDAQIRSGRAQAQRFLFDKRFPGAARIRTI